MGSPHSCLFFHRSLLYPHSAPTPIPPANHASLFPFPSLRHTIPSHPFPSALPSPRAIIARRSDPRRRHSSPLGGGQIRWAWPMERAGTVAFFSSPGVWGRRPPPLCVSTCVPPVVDRELGVAGLDVRRQEDQGRGRVPQDSHGLCPALGSGRDGAPCDAVGWEAACCRGSGQALTPAATDRGGGGCRSAGEVRQARPATAKFLSACEL
jgi:hypothetical protein